ncbi:MAG: hypothetical protein AAFU54_30010 [Chloroflexota bacterium]
MSDTSLYSGLYKTIDEYSSLVDRVLLSISEDNASSVTDEQKRLGSFLLGIAQSDTDNLSTYMISQLLNETDELDDLDLAAAGRALQKGEIDTEIRRTIEQFATVLDRERTKVMARIRGNRR